MGSRPVRDYIYIGGHFYFPVPPDSLQEWCEERAGKPLWQLQIEIGEWGIKTLESLSELSNAQKAEPIRNIKTAVEKLHETKTAIVDNRFPPYMGESRYFYAEDAKAIRDEYLNYYLPREDMKRDMKLEDGKRGHP